MQPPASACEDLLSLVLSNCCLSTTDAARLLCTSQETADLVRQRLAGTLKITIKGNTPLSAAQLSWLGKNAVLLGILQYRGTPTVRNSFRTSAAEAAVEAAAASAAKEFSAALARAAALPGGLMLRRLSTSSFPVLQVSATCRSLTSLDLTLHKESLFPSADEATTCIAGLGSQLRTLKLHAPWLLFDSTGDSAQWFGTRLYVPGCGLHSVLRAALPELNALTSLEVDEVPDASLLKYAPPQLKRLQVMGVDDQSNTALELGHLTGLTDLRMFRSNEYEQEGWRVVGAPDVLPPNLKVLSIVDCKSAAPLLPLSRLTSLSISEHCHMPVAELQRLSVLTQLRESRLGYTVYRGSGGEHDAEEGSAGWGFVPALRSLELHRQWIDPWCDLLQHLAGLTNLTRLVWDSTMFHPNMGRFGDQAEGVYMLNDGGMYALGAALPPSLVQVVFESFVAYPDERFGVRESDIVKGVRDFKLTVLERLPLLQLESCTFDPDCGLSEAGRKLVDMILAADLRLPEADEAVMEAFFDAYPDWLASSELSGEEEEGGTGDEGIGSEGVEDDAEAQQEEGEEAGAPEGQEEPGQQGL